MIEFPVTRRLVGGFDPWIAALVAPHLPFVQVPAKAGSYYWRFRDENAHALLVGKHVRMVTSIRGALLCADASYVSEAFSLLRLVADFSDEVIAIGEGLAKGRLTSTQQAFVNQYFTPFPETVDDHASAPQQRYVTKEQFFASHQRMTEKAKGDVGAFRRVSRYGQKGYDSYVHGAYDTSMELFRGDEQRFMLSGHSSAKYLCLAYTSLAAKLMQVLFAFQMSAVAHGLDDLRLEAEAARQELDESGEGLSAKCAAVPQKRPTAV